MVMPAFGYGGSEFKFPIYGQIVSAVSTDFLEYSVLYVKFDPAFTSIFEPYLKLNYNKFTEIFCVSPVMFLDTKVH